MNGLNLGARTATPTPTATPAQQKPPVEAETKQPAPIESEDDEVIYSVYPLDKFSIGTTWEFEKGVLKVTRKESEKIDKYLKTADHATRNQVKKIDRAVADAMVRNLRPVATKQFDSATFSEGRHERTEIGTVDIAQAQPQGE